MIDVGSLLQEHLYTALVVGALVEGETPVVMAGFAAHRGYASLPEVIALAAGLNFAMDQFYFALGLRHGERILARIPRLRAAVASLSPRIHRHRHLVVVLMRFMYGTRIAGPIALGLARVDWHEYLLANAAGALLWASVFALLGYAFGEGIAALVGHAAHYEALALAAIVAGGVVFALWHRFRRRRPPGSGAGGQ